VLIELLANGFKTLPVGMNGLDGEALWNVVAWGSQLFAGALTVALPGMTALLIVNLAFGLMTRAAPTLNLFAVGFPVTLIAGLLIVYAGLPTVQASFVDLLENAFDFVRALQGGG
jgi:flagellar biosynthetic protein FliR